MHRRRSCFSIRNLALGIFLALCTACISVSLGSKFRINPSTQLKIGHDQQKDVIHKMGPPYRRVVDSKGREIFTYIWASGEGAGQKCIVAFNKNGVVSIVEVSP